MDKVRKEEVCWRAGEGITKKGPLLSGLFINYCLISVTLFQGCCRHINILYLLIN